MSPLTRLYSWTRSRADRNSSGEYLADFAQRAVDSVPPRALVLDAGSSPGTPHYFCFGKHRTRIGGYSGTCGRTISFDRPVVDRLDCFKRAGFGV